MEECLLSLSYEATWNPRVLSSALNNCSSHWRFTLSRNFSRPLSACRVFHTADVGQRVVFRVDAGIVDAGGNGMCAEHLAVVVPQLIAAETVQHIDEAHTASHDHKNQYTGNRPMALLLPPTQAMATLGCRPIASCICALTSVSCRPCGWFIPAWLRSSCL